MLIEIKGKFSADDLHEVIDILSSYFQEQGIEEFVAVDIDLKPFSKTIQAPASISDAQGREIRSLEITKTKSGTLELKENAVDNTWIKNPFGTQDPGELTTHTWLLYVIALGLFILYLIWDKHWFF